MFNVFMKKFFGIIFLLFLLNGNANSLPMEGFQVINKLIEKGYELHSSTAINTGKYKYNLISDGSDGKHRLITCVYTIEQNVAICWVP